VDNEQEERPGFCSEGEKKSRTEKGSSGITKVYKVRYSSNSILGFVHMNMSYQEN
jgi:hypothetical protein